MDGSIAMMFSKTAMSHMAPNTRRGSCGSLWSSTDRDAHVASLSSGDASLSIPLPGFESTRGGALAVRPAPL